jgi:PAS domain S-box-containing protein
MYFPGEGAMARAVREKDWSQTLLGPVSTWSSGIRTAVNLCLDSQFQLAVLCGPELVYVYNDATIPICGDKHPWALGQRTVDVWPEAWPTIGPMLHSVLATGEATRHNDLLLVLQRYGYYEECYFTFSYSAVRTEENGIGGVFVAVLETSDRVISERRQRTLGDIATQVAVIHDEESAFDGLASTLSRNPYDVPFAALYLRDGDGARLAFSTSPGDGAAPALRISLHAVVNAATEHPVARAARTGEPQLFDAGLMLDGVKQCGAWPELPRQALVLPFALAGQRAPHGFLVVGVNPRKALDDEYRAFFGLVAGHVATAVANIAALQDTSRLLTAVFDRTPGGIAIIELGGRFARANAAYQNLVGYSEQELLGMTMESLVHPEDFPLKRAMLEQLLEGRRESFQMELRYLRRDGSEVWFQNFVSTIDDEHGRPRYFVKIVQNISDRKRVEAEIASSQQELRILYDRLQSVRQEERVSLAREVHDQLGQILSAAKIDIKLLEDDIRPGGAPLSRRKISAELRSARRTLEQAIQQVRQIATELRPPELEDQGLYTAVEWHARDFERRTRIACRVMLPSDLCEPVGPAAIALFRIFQEAMTNILRHAQASHVWVCIARRGDAILLRVRDDGIGIPAGQVRSTRSIGLTGMRERAAIAKGRLVVGAMRGGGTLVSARIPLAGADAGAASHEGDRA